MSTCQLDSSTGDNFLAPHHGEGCIHMPSPAPALNMQRVTQVLTTLGHHSDNYKDALKIMQQYGKGCDTSGLQSEAENEELPEKRNRKLVHRLGDSDDSEEDPGNSDLASLGTSPWGRTHSYAFTSTCIKHAESYTRNGSPSSTPFTPLTSSPQHVADTGAWIQPGLQANMARGKNGRQHFLLWCCE
ncbi:uncharacterized protein LOC133640258 isoform X4 [Entelurus aequoreus]|uniref:uncharacterized protein LOC133640258 isoform X4 n=1 Tax=Entelurus aequoreus TaxID=161455 RepID=UPI002B1E0A02|nr:uncharacterized protein LOC133640258 isoform X4 [Entelurus aequoreus]